jgi:hypothetical protein
MIVVGLTVAGLIIAIATLVWPIRAHRRDHRDAECNEVNGLLRWLGGRRILWTPAIREVPDEATRSILAIRERVDTTLSKVSKPAAVDGLRVIRDGCIAMLDEPSGLAMFDPSAMRALEKFRQLVLPATAALASCYGLVPLEALPTFRGGWESGSELKAIYVVLPGEIPELSHPNQEASE